MGIAQPVANVFKYVIPHDECHFPYYPASAPLTAIWFCCTFPATSPVAPTSCLQGGASHSTAFFFQTAHNSLRLFFLYIKWCRILVAICWTCCSMSTFLFPAYWKQIGPSRWDLTTAVYRGITTASTCWLQHGLFWAKFSAAVTSPLQGSHITSACRLLFTSEEAGTKTGLC